MSDVFPIDTLVSVDQWKLIHQLGEDTGCRLEDLPRAIAEEDGENVCEIERVKSVLSACLDDPVLRLKKFRVNT